MSIFAQEPGKSGELLKNDARSTEMQTQRNSNSAKTGEVQTQSSTNVGRSNEKILDNSNYRKPTQSNNQRPVSNSSYRWNYNVGNSEVFVRIPENGNYSVEIDDQYMSNSSGKFRFFDMRAGTTIISIYENNYLVYRTRIYVKNNSRLVLDFFSDYGLYLLGNFPVQNQSYGINEWDDVWNNPYGNQNGNYNGNSGYNGNYNGKVMNNIEFDYFTSSLNKASAFDDNKIEIIKIQMKKVAFTANQIKFLVAMMKFDSNKIKIAKQMYIKCVDKQNFYKVYEALDYESSRREVMQYVDSID